MTPQIDMTPQICGHRSFADIFHGRSIPLDLLPALSRKRTKQKHKAQLITIIRSTNVTEVVFFYILRNIYLIRNCMCRQIPHWATLNWM
jgi:hypothetical protein